MRTVMLRAVVVDDHNLVRTGIRLMLERQPGVRVVGEASDGYEAISVIAELRPDIALLDISMPRLNGLEAAQRIRQESPGTRLVMLSMHRNERYVAQALKLGVAGYLLKQACPHELPVLLHAVMRGETYLSPGISKQLVRALLARTSDGDVPIDELLTARQREILQLMAAGHSTREIAQLLSLSVKTVETHRAQVVKRLDIHDVAGLVHYAIRTGLIALEEE